MPEITNQTTGHQTPASDLQSPSSDRSSPSGSAPRLEKPVRITEQVWPEVTVPVVSILCVTYNHINFIRDAIEGFLMQETTFPLEIVIHDDASTDGTAEIVKEYAEKYPQVFRTILQKKNLYSSGNLPNGGEMAQRYCHGEFIALCEGDDYWISKEKLQKQVEALEKNKQVSFVFHKAFEELVNFQSKSSLNSNFRGVRFQLTDMFKFSFVIPTASMLMRKACISSPNWLSGCICGDRALQLILLDKGPAVFIEKTWSVYRTHAGGVTRAISKNYATTVIPNWIAMYYGFNETTENRHGNLIQKEIRRLVGERSRFQIYALRAEQTSFRGDDKPPETMQSRDHCCNVIQTLLEDTAACLRDSDKEWFLRSAIYKETVAEALLSTGDAWYVRKQFGRACQFYQAASSEGSRRADFYRAVLKFGYAGRAVRSLMHRAWLGWSRVSGKGAKSEH